MNHAKSSPLAVLLAAIALAQTPDAAPTATKEITVAGDRQWTDTGIDVQPGDDLRMTATGSIEYPTSKKPIGPEGSARAWTDLLRTFPLNDAGRGALIGRIGDKDAVRPFLIGPRRDSRASIAGRLFLGINQPAEETAKGTFVVRVDHVGKQRAKRVSGAGGEAAAQVKLTQEQIDSLPARVGDDQGTLGDRVNFVIVGTEDKLRAALQTAGWVTVDKSIKDALLRGVLASLSKQAYTTLPMSELKLFGRGQDYGYAQGDPVQVVAARHHFRIWKAPFTVDGQTVWAGAGTHDVGFDRDQRNGKLTHKIDPEVDKERDYIGRSLYETGQVTLLDYVTPKDTIREAKTAHGQSFSSDGRTLAIYLQPDIHNVSGAFADVFCSVLKQVNPDTGEWGACSQYLKGSGKEDSALPPLPVNYRILIVPGFMSSCFSDAPAYAEGQEHLRKKYGMTVELLPVPNDSSDDNAKLIAAYLNEKMKADPRKYIVLGYSKGTPDVQVALAKEPGAAAAVAAFIAVAGASGGSPIADTIPSQADRWVKLMPADTCKGDLSLGFKSLRRDVRQAFLASFPHPVVPTYSLVALSDTATTSKALLNSWQLLRVFDTALDGQLTKADAMIPEAKYLGAALADHFGVALPFDKSPDALIRSNMGTRYPRAALLEAMVRYVVADLAAK